MNNLKSYGCVKCQVRHYSFDTVFDRHIMYQSKHGVDGNISNEEGALALFPKVFEERDELLAALKLVVEDLTCDKELCSGEAKRGCVPAIVRAAIDRATKQQ